MCAFHTTFLGPPASIFSPVFFHLFGSKLSRPLSDSRRYLMVLHAAESDLLIGMQLHDVISILKFGTNYDSEEKVKTLEIKKF